MLPFSNINPPGFLEHFLLGPAWVYTGQFLCQSVMFPTIYILGTIYTSSCLDLNLIVPELVCYVLYNIFTWNTVQFLSQSVMIPTIYILVWRTSRHTFRRNVCKYLPEQNSCDIYIESPYQYFLFSLFIDQKNIVSCSQTFVFYLAAAKLGTLYSSSLGLNLIVPELVCYVLYNIFTWNTIQFLSQSAMFPTIYILGTLYSSSLGLNLIVPELVCYVLYNIFTWNTIQFLSQSVMFVGTPLLALLDIKHFFKSRISYNEVYFTKCKYKSKELLQ